MSHEDKRNKGREKWHAQSTKRPSLTCLQPLPTSERGSCHLAILGELDQENESKMCDKQSSRECDKEQKGGRRGDGALADYSGMCTQDDFIICLYSANGKLGDTFCICALYLLVPSSY